MALLSMSRTLFILLLAGLSLYGQSGEAPVYRAQLESLDAAIKKIHVEVAELPPDGAISVRLNISERLFALVKLAHRLEESAAEANGTLLSNGRTTDKRLLLIQQACKGLDFVLAALSHYVSTQDRSFLGLASDGRATVNSINKLL